jgi:hypothetical protein
MEDPKNRRRAKIAQSQPACNYATIRRSAVHHCPVLVSSASPDVSMLSERLERRAGERPEMEFPRDVRLGFRRLAAKRTTVENLL